MDIVDADNLKMAGEWMMHRLLLLQVNSCLERHVHVPPNVLLLTFRWTFLSKVESFPVFHFSKKSFLDLASSYLNG